MENMIISLIEPRTKISGVNEPLQLSQSRSSPHLGHSGQRVGRSDDHTSVSETASIHVARCGGVNSYLRMGVLFSHPPVMVVWLERLPLSSVA